MNKRSVQYYSDGVRLEGLIVAPADLRPNDRRPTVIICSGFQGVKEWVPSRWWPQFVEAGFVCLAFDYRGFGTSDGERGRIVPEEEIADVRCSITFLQQQPEVDPRRISLLGWGLGGGIAIAAAARDTRAIAVACVNGLGDGGRTVRDAVPYPAWLDMQERLAADRVKRVMTGQSDHVPYREVTHPGGLLTAVEQSSGYAQLSNDGRSAGKVPVETFSLQSAEAYYHFRPEVEVGQISPRPVLIVHGASNPYMPVDEAHRLYARAGEPRELLIIPGGKHLEWIEPTSPLHRPYVARVVEWFRRRLPVAAAA
jgi:alpha-beta hydrolase superfamily lysophospholipase